MNPSDRRDSIHADEPRSTAPLRYGAYFCVCGGAAARDALAQPAVDALAAATGWSGEFTRGGDPPQAIAFLRRVAAAEGATPDEGLRGADAVVHCAATTAEPVNAFGAALARLLPSEAGVRTLGGVVRPPRFTGDAMHDFAYAHRVLQQPGADMPHAFLLPMSKTPDWWAKDWMERHTYMLPRYDGAGRMVAEGHALSAASGVSALYRRTYKHPDGQAPSGAYDFVNYFECADEGVPVFAQVCSALRDTARNPEWAFVREGPTWHGRRVASWAELWA